MRNFRGGLTASVIAALSVGGGAWAQDGTAGAGGVTFPDVPATHWAYEAVTDLANKGLVKGYLDGSFLGKRPLTRYEFAEVIERILKTIADINIKTAGVPNAAIASPTGAPVTSADIEKIQALVDAFKTQIDADTADIAALKNAGYQTQIDALRKEIGDLKTAMARPDAGANRAYGYGPGRFQLTGYVQARYEKVTSGSQTAYPNGTTAITGANNGNYQVGGTNQTFYVRRARLKATGNITDDANYGIQIEAANASAAVPITVREAYVSYTFEVNEWYSPTVTAGQFRTPFGFVLPESPADQFTAERPMAFSDNATYSLFENQNFDRGVEISTVLNHSALRATIELINGGGSGSISTKRRPDQIYRLAAQSLAGFGQNRQPIDLGVSYYNGEISRSTLGNPSGEPAFIGSNYEGAKKTLLGLDASVTTASGVFVQAEYATGRYDERTYVSAETGDDVGTAVSVNQFAPNNHVRAWYIMGGIHLGPSPTRPLMLGASYDEFDRSRSGVASTTVDQYGKAIAGGESGSSFDDGNFGYGGTYNLDRATRLKIWFDQPTKVAHAANLASPKKVGLFTTELQVRF